MGKPKIISLFTGAGGMDYGFEAAGFETVVALEFDHDCCDSLRTSRPHLSVMERSIFDVPTGELLETGGLRRGDEFVLMGGPPCQPFSKSSYWARGAARRLDDPRADTLSAYMRVVEEALPSVFVLENVTGLAFSGKDEGLRLLLDKVQRINAATRSHYKPCFQVLNAASYGVPQMRERFVLVASRDGAPFAFPAPTHAEGLDKPALLDVGLLPYRTAWDAIGDVNPDAEEDLAVKGKWAELLPSIPEGQNYLFHTDRGGGLPLFGWRRRFWTFLLKLAKNRPSWTIQAQPGPAVGPFHWENRRLSVRELARIQTFPDDVQFQGTRSSAQRQIGNAVPSLMAEVLGRSIRTQLLGRTPVRGPLKLLPPARGPVPAPEKPIPVPEDFRKLVGEHEAHPGTGKGYGAKSRLRSVA
ncbi:DNA cytosine methyltransferase [Corallococcus sicarius]|uniref:DNA (cytosine-5-)-methyltransferase n=1 Tax=Corallococcus sicarius TaxID=2316726 RepID=A0A3A8NVI1_9BACT|nr:DNA cytosine methyltransferase [Corallococcus sicarius]RKH43484.1 DNA cytosine methyltransferase [Corallococcus sicarius]